MDDEVNKELKNQEGIEVLCDDLLYQEAGININIPKYVKILNNF